MSVLWCLRRLTDRIQAQIEIKSSSTTPAMRSSLSTWLAAAGMRDCTEDGIA